MRPSRPPSAPPYDCAGQPAHQCVVHLDFAMNRSCVQAMGDGMVTLKGHDYGSDRFGAERAIASR
jgi:hypothetical protein